MLIHTVVAESEHDTDVALFVDADAARLRAGRIAAEFLAVAAPADVAAADRLVAALNDADDGDLAARWVHIRPRQVTFDAALPPSGGAVVSESSVAEDVHVQVHQTVSGFAVDVAVSDEAAAGTTVEVYLDGERLA